MRLPRLLQYLVLALGTLLVVTFLLIVRFKMYPAIYEETAYRPPFPLWWSSAHPYHITPPRIRNASSTPYVSTAPRPLIIPASYVFPKTGCQVRFDIAYIYLYEKDKHIPENLERLKQNKSVHEEMLNKAGRGYVTFDLSYPVVEMEVTEANRRRLTFLNPDGTTEALNTYRILEEFFKTNPDAFDFIHIFTNFDHGEKDFARYEPHGLPMTPIGRLLGIGRMWNINDWDRFLDINKLWWVKTPSDLTDRQLACAEGETVVHETAHQWGAYIGDYGNNTSSTLPLRSWISKTHWYGGLDTGNDALGGSRFQQNPDGSFTTLPYQEYCATSSHPSYFGIPPFSDLTLYLVGAKEPEEVQQMLWIQYDGRDDLLREVGLYASPPSPPRYITVDDIIARYGTRQCLPRTTPSEEDLERMERTRKLQF